MKKTPLFVLALCLLVTSFAKANTSSLFDESTINRIAVEQAALAPAQLSDTDTGGYSSGLSPVMIEDNSITQANLDFEKNTSLSRFHINLARNFRNLFDTRNLQAFLIGAGATGAFRSVDEEFHEYFQHENTRDFVANAGATLGKPYVLAPALASMLVFGRYSSDNRFKAYSYAMVQGFVVNSVTTLALKDVVGRTRPDGSDNYSFPSGHTSDFFMFATITDNYYGHKAGIVAYGLASFVAFSRVKRDVHYMSDVIAGATMGYIVGRTVSRTIGIPQTKKVSWMPVVDPINKSYGVSLAFQLP